MTSRVWVIVAVMAIAVLLVGSTASSHSAEAKKKSKKYEVIFYLNVDAPFKGKKTPIKLGIENIKNKIVASKEVDANFLIDDGDEERIILGALKVKDTKGSHLGQVAACLIVNHAHDEELCDGNLKKAAKNVNAYTVEFSYAELLQLVFG